MMRKPGSYTKITTRPKRKGDKSNDVEELSAAHKIRSVNVNVKKFPSSIVESDTNSQGSSNLNLPPKSSRKKYEKGNTYEPITDKIGQEKTIA